MEEHSNHTSRVMVRRRWRRVVTKLSSCVDRIKPKFRPIVTSVSNSLCCLNQCLSSQDLCDTNKTKAKRKTEPAGNDDDEDGNNKSSCELCWPLILMWKTNNLVLSLKWVECHLEMCFAVFFFSVVAMSKINNWQECSEIFNFSSSSTLISRSSPVSPSRGASDRSLSQTIIYHKYANIIDLDTDNQTIEKYLVGSQSFTTSLIW